ncbi:LacI family DNA-binding transcriptional regulator [Motiliproteus sp. MSK22-1]|uniref:LacI family DNA-binding transcriptional regulator n=1 Tax=Motiliproteus sp. MSK22-1 TaxID=1897630 RepID=UPI0009772B96|nr:LacI family DNA-binding transcriptional regulator [Motiliproteus sp. MSK22-1]OMH25808.1 transcriptional regulator [Motiliproteus sp. MSK22-1]
MTQAPSKSRSRSKGRVTLSDVAQRSGVSAITVSRALNDPEKVSPNVRDRIEKAVSELGYIPNRAAKSLATNSTNTIAVVIPSISNTVFSSVVKGIYDVCTPLNYEVLFANTYYSIQNEENLLSKLLTQHPDGIIVTGLDISERSEKLLKSASIPVVQIMEVGQQQPIDMNVGISHYDAGKTMGKYLVRKGYQRIGFIGAQMDFRSQRRMSGFLSALAEAGHDSSRYVLTTPEPSTVKLGGQLIGDMLMEHPDIDAVFCNNDDIAYGAIYECQRRHLRIPEQIAIAGFNDLDASACINPSLTTIKTPLYEIGKTAAELLIKRLKNQPIKETQIDLGIKLQERDSA